jgi:hypothetical protein
MKLVILRYIIDQLEKKGIKLETAEDFRQLFTVTDEELSNVGLN